MSIIKMGGIEGRAYYGYNNALQNTKDRYYQKYVKPVLDKDVDPLELAAGAAGVVGSLATGGNPISGYNQGKGYYNIVKAISNHRPSGYHPALDKPPRWY
jgi:hypothetical protein